MKANIYKTRLDENRYPILVNEEGKYFCDGRKKFSDPETVMEFCTTQLHLQDCAEEYVYCFVLNTALRLTGLFEVSHGTVNSSLVSPREIFQKLLMLNGTSFILVHNHPSGDPTPSNIDVELTKRLGDAGRLMDINLIEHLIVGDNTYYSFAENNYVIGGK